MSPAALKRDKKSLRSIRQKPILVKNELDFIKFSQDKAAVSVINSALIIKKKCPTCVQSFYPEGNIHFLLEYKRLTTLVTRWDCRAPQDTRRSLH